MEKIVRQTLLYDFYGELLTDRQRDIYETVVMGDLTLSEAAEDYGISRQGIHDLVKRSTKQLEDYESRLHLVERFLKIRGEAEKIRDRAESLEDSVPEITEITEIRESAEKILSDL